jgi:pyruvate/2-oxoglutarate dehydrogenase complex dihydrolipoamide dehydrogenase (E3) component
MTRDPIPFSVPPMDEYNRVLVNNVHPHDWNNPEPSGRYNLVVLGAGTAGLVTAAGAAGLGAKVALIERHLMGGDCLNVGCVPSTALIHSARVRAEVRDAARNGVLVPEGTRVDFGMVMERLRRLRSQISHHDSFQRFSDLGIDVYMGEPRFASKDTVEVDGKQLRFKKAVIATGARAFEPPIEGLAEAGYLTNETVFNLTERPNRLLVIGAGPIGCEMAQAFQRLGSQVTLLETAPQILVREDPDAAKIVADSIENDGVRFLLNSSLEKVTRNGSSKVAHIKHDGKEESLEIDEILIGVGRVPNVEGLNLEGAGVHYDSKQGVVVDDTLRTTNPHIYAAGDICLPYKFTHVADFAARIVIQNALFADLFKFGRKRFSALTIPWCTYTDPEIAHVGLYERDAQERGIEIETFEMSMAEIDRAIVEEETEGLVKIHVKKGTDRIVGATIVARHAGETIGELATAIVGKVGLGRIANVIHPYPTQAEIVRKVGDLYNRTKLTPRLKRILNWLMAVQR